MIQVFTDNSFKDVNAYLVYNDQNEGILIDTANVKYKEILEFTQENNITITDIFITHGHFSHFYGINEIVDAHHPKNIYVSKEDLLMLFDPIKNTSSLYNIENDGWIPQPFKNLKVLQNETEMVVNGYRIKIIPCPGHTPGSLMIVFVDAKCIFNGDSIFLKKSPVMISVNNYEEEKIIENIIYLIENYLDEYALFPGHFEYGFEVESLLAEDSWIKRECKLDLKK